MSVYSDLSPQLAPVWDRSSTLIWLAVPAFWSGMLMLSVGSSYFT